MSIKPVDLQVMIPKMTEVARIAGIENERSILASQQGNNNTKEMVKADLKEVRKKKDVQKVNKIDKSNQDDQNKNSKKGKRQSRDAESSSSNAQIAKKEKEKEPSKIDIKL